MKAYFVWLILLPVFTLSLHASKQPRQDMAVVAHSGATHAYEKMRAQHYLSISDVAELSRRKVDPNITLRYLQKFQVAYYLNPSQVNQLKEAGVSKKVLNYMQASAHMYGTKDRNMNPDYNPFNSFNEDFFRIHHYYPDPSRSKTW
jgi:hypothetical protein